MSFLPAAILRGGGAGAGADEQDRPRPHPDHFSFNERYARLTIVRFYRVCFVVEWQPRNTPRNSSAIATVAAQPKAGATFLGTTPSTRLLSLRPRCSGASERQTSWKGLAGPSSWRRRGRSLLRPKQQCLNYLLCPTRSFSTSSHALPLRKATSQASFRSSARKCFQEAGSLQA